MKIGRFIKKFWNTLESYDGLTKIIFKNKIHYKLWDGTWDLTSLVLKKTIDSDFDRNYKNYLDIGCGHVALFGQYIKKKYPKTHVVSSDKYSNVINCAKKNIFALYCSAVNRSHPVWVCTATINDFFQSTWRNRQSR